MPTRESDGGTGVAGLELGWRVVGKGEWGARVPGLIVGKRKVRVVPLQGRAT